jgi:predicted DNA-binding transcriptional regulator YafY
MAKGTHDPLVYRLCQILIKLNHGEKLYRDQLVDEFGVTARTIQRDMNVRFAYLPIEKKGTCYWLDPAYLGRLTISDIRRFAELAGVAGLFPSFDNEFLRDIFDSRVQSALLIKGHSYEDLKGKEGIFKRLELAIIALKRIHFDYIKPVKKPYHEVEPYRLINNKGVWYLAAMHNGKMKTFAFAKIANVIVLESSFTQNDDLMKQLENEDGVWISEKPIEVVVKVSASVAGYFKRRKLIANQVIEKELECGGLILSAKVGHVNQIIPIVRYWIPHIRVISPDGIQKEVDQSLRGYLETPLQH